MEFQRAARFEVLCEMVQEEFELVSIERNLSIPTLRRREETEGPPELPLDLWPLEREPPDQEHPNHDDENG